MNIHKKVKNQPSARAINAVMALDLALAEIINNPDKGSRRELIRAQKELMRQAVIIDRAAGIQDLEHALQEISQVEMADVGHSYINLSLFMKTKARMALRGVYDYRKCTCAESKIRSS